MAQNLSHIRFGHVKALLKGGRHRLLRAIEVATGGFSPKRAGHHRPRSSELDLVNSGLEETMGVTTTIRDALKANPKLRIFERRLSMPSTRLPARTWNRIFP
jgi:hypothetical protein